MKRLLLAATALLASLAAVPAGAVTFSYTGVIDTWIVPQDGLWDIVATGAQGGAGLNVPAFTAGSDIAPFAGGRGAQIGGTFSLPSGTVLRIAVGGMGGSGDYNGGGGGGSFVVGPGDTPLVIAGGGGGVRLEAGQDGWDANTGQAGLTGSGGESTGGGDALSGSIGQGGPAAAQSSYGSGGGGFGSNGGDDSDSGTGGASWANGLAGGNSDGCEFGGGAGGFGGGGSGAGCFGGGGGGGYSGGEGGWIAGGGGSYNADTLTGWAEAGIGYGNGLVTITLHEAVGVPEPASAGLAVLGLFALAAIRRRR